MKEKIIAIAKEEGLEIAEESVKDLVEVVFKVMDEVVAETENTIDDMVYAALKAKGKAYLLDKADEINPEDNE